MPASPETLERLGVPLNLRDFEPTRAAGLARAAAARPEAYARTRNRLDGAVTGLSPYLTHGLLTLPEAAAQVARHHRLEAHDKLATEFGWREFFHHAWDHAGDGILRDMRPTLPWPGRYGDAVPGDVREGRTGVPAIDAAVRVLYATGYLHNHARLWLASYLVHLRKVHWRAGADWLWGHLLDGDLASNHLGWQWVAGCFSAKPYLFNAGNVAAWAPAAAAAAWDCAGTALDTGEEALAALAREAGDLGPQTGDAAGVAEPPLLRTPPPHLLSGLPRLLGPQEVPDTGGRPLELVHPWALGPGGAPGAFRLGVVHLPAHAAWPWSERRWRFVLQAMASGCDAVWLGDLGRGPWPATPLAGTECRFPGYRQAWADLRVDARPVPRLFEAPGTAARSFSAFWRHAGPRGIRLAGEGQSRHG